VQSFPWADETPNQNQHAVYVPLESQTTFVVSNGPDEGSGSLRFDSITDVDTFMFLARGGESYGVNTESLFGGTDTMISVFRSDGSLVASNDDCHPGDLSSCVSFTPATTGYYRVRVSPYNPSLTGPAATYNLRVSMYNDDVADTMSGALALSMRPDAPWRVASLSSGDVDFFKVAVGSSQTLSFQGCSYSFALTLDVYDQNGSLLQTLTNPSGCGTITLGQQAVGAGVYYFRARSAIGAADTYFLRVMAQNPDIDANGPFFLRSTDSGRTYGSQFETEHDQDFYAFSASTEGQWFTIETLGLGINVDTVLEVYAPSSTLYGRLNPPNVDGFSDMSGVGYGQWMLLDDDGGLDARGSRLNFLAPVAGTYYVRVRNKFQSPGEYVIMFEQGTATTTSGWNTAYP